MGFSNFRQRIFRSSQDSQKAQERSVQPVQTDQDGKSVISDEPAQDMKTEFYAPAKSSGLEQSPRVEQNPREKQSPRELPSPREQPSPRQQSDARREQSSPKTGAQGGAASHRIPRKKLQRDPTKQEAPYPSPGYFPPNQPPGYQHGPPSYNGSPPFQNQAPHSPYAAQPGPGYMSPQQQYPPQNGYMSPQQHYPPPQMVRWDSPTPALGLLRKLPKQQMPVPPMPNPYQMAQGWKSFGGVVSRLYISYSSGRIVNVPVLYAKPGKAQSVGQYE
ncbi:MAG: hypothetical protein Q9222_007012 [Ikaeria aurantiellina]